MVRKVNTKNKTAVKESQISLNIHQRQSLEEIIGKTRAEF